MNLHIQVLKKNELPDYFEVMQELFENLTTKEQLQESLPKLLEQVSAQFVGATFGLAKAGFCQFHIEYNLEGLKYCIVDELVVASQFRSHGLGSKIINFVHKYAQENDCKFIKLSSSTNRHLAHRFYFQNGYMINHFGFSKEV